MNRLLIAAVIQLMLVPASFAADLVARQGNDSVRLTDKPCTSEAVLARLAAATKDEYKAASAVFQGTSYVACWRMTGNVAHLVYEDGDQGIIPAQALKPLTEI